MMSLLAGLALIVVGLVTAFFGYRLFRILLPLYGAVFGFVTAWGWWGDSAWLLAIVAGVAFAVILGAFAYGLWSLAVGFTGVVFGLALASIIATSLNMWAWLAVLLAAVLALAFGFLFVKIRNEAVIIATATVGAATAARGIGELFGLQAGFGGLANRNPTWLILLMVAVFGVVGAYGLVIQWKNYRRLKLYDRTKAGEGQPAPATATRGTSVPVSAGAASTGAAAPAVAAPAAVAVAGAAVVAADKLAEPEAPLAEVVEAPAEEAVVAGAAVVAADKLAEPEAPLAEVVEAPAEEAAVTGAAVVAADKLAEPEAPLAEVVEAPVEAAVVAGADAVSSAEETAVEAIAGTGGAPVVLGAAIANKVEDTLSSEDVVQAAEEVTEAADANIVDEVVTEIQETYSYEDNAKFKEMLEFVEGIGPAYAEKLRAVGINTVLELLQHGATRKGRLELVEATGITGKLILRWVNHADLFRIKGVGSEYADLLEVAGVDTVVELAKRNPANLLHAMTEMNRVRKLVRREPVASQVEDWVAQAKTLPRVVQY